jgi:hypothetical protein
MLQLPMLCTKKLARARDYRSSSRTMTFSRRSRSCLVPMGRPRKRTARCARTEPFRRCVVPHRRAECRGLACPRCHRCGRPRLFRAELIVDAGSYIEFICCDACVDGLEARDQMVTIVETIEERVA